MTKEITFEIFGRIRHYEVVSYGLCAVDEDLITLKKLGEEIEKPQILSYIGLDTINIYIPEDRHFMASDMIEYIYQMEKDKVHKTLVRDCLLACSIEDTDWTDQRNKEYTCITFREIVFKKEIQDMVKKKLREYSDSLVSLRSKMEREIEAEEKRIKEEKRQWKIVKIFESISPKGGEDGTDGYFDAEYKSLAGETVRMVSRNVFDFGSYNYPKRVEGTEEVIETKGWTGIEKSLNIWLCKYGPFHGIRM